MRTAKLSLHASGIWRFAHTETFAAAVGLQGDRLIQRVTPPSPMVRGWRRAATVIVPTRSLREPIPEKLNKGTRVSWWPASRPGWTINFEVMVSDADPDFDEYAAFDCIGEVGRIPLSGGGGVLVLADEKHYGPWESSLQTLRENMRATLTESRQANVEHLETLAWGTSDNDGHPIFYDLGDVRSAASNGYTELPASDPH